MMKSPERAPLIRDIQKMWVNSQNANSVLPCLSVRTALDLYLRVMNFPPGSEVIVSAVNIPDMIHVLKAHNLRIVSLDINLETMAPKLHLLEQLITEKTKILLIANIFGRRFDVTPFIAVAKRHQVAVVEDLAEGFSGFDYMGHPESDLSLFSFGPIKYFTAFGGAIAKVRNTATFEKMERLYESYPLQTHMEYLKKVLKYSLVYILLNCPSIVKPGMYLTRSLDIDHKKYVVKLLRGFPNHLIERLRHRPSTALLAMMKDRMSTFDSAEINLSNVKAEYVSERLPTAVTQVGKDAAVRNHWLFPVIVVSNEFPSEKLIYNRYCFI